MTEIKKLLEGVTITIGDGKPIPANKFRESDMKKIVDKLHPESKKEVKQG